MCPFNKSFSRTVSYTKRDSGCVTIKENMDRLSWQTIEYLHSKKSTDWYWIVGAITVSIAIIAIILNNIIFAILIVVASFTMTLFASRPPQVLDVEISNSGLSLNHIHHTYSELESFWVELNDPNPKIIFKSKKVFMPFIVIFLEDMDPEEIHSVLSKLVKKLS